MKQRTSLLRETGGVAIIEFALVLPLLLMVMIGIFEFGFAFREFLLVTSAAREGARMAVLLGYSDDDVKARVRDYLTKAGGVQPAMIQDIEVATDASVSAADGTTYTVKTVTARVNHNFSMIAPFGGTYGTVPLAAVAVMRVEVAAEAAP